MFYNFLAGVLKGCLVFEVVELDILLLFGYATVI